ncbi:acyltransferase family protein [Modestobacter versicolor]|uniref:acyltransferase family protein n=1 Tax=Modestobacter versicolor TaxID=429133 RepID=UPI0034DFB96D
MSSVPDLTRRDEPAGWLRGQSLAGAFDPRRNALGFLRLLFAGVVALIHAWQTGFGHQPSVGRTLLGDLAVDGFFVLSGFLVAASWLRLQSVRRYAWHRFLRIMPGFWVCLVVTAVLLAPIAAVLAGRDAGSVLTGEEPAWRYVLANAGLPVLQYGIGGVPHPTEAGSAVFDGALWTLQYEAFCYGVIALLGVAGVLHRRSRLLAVVALVWVALAAETAGLVPVDVPVLANEQVFRFLLVFLLGAAAHVYADVVPVHRAWAVGAAVLTSAALVLFDQYRLLGGVGFAYLCVYAAVRSPLKGNPRWDLSYGLYVYHYPVQLLMALGGLAVLGEWGFAALSIALAAVLAAVSWVVVERPALRLKDAAWVERRVSR